MRFAQTATRRGTPIALDKPARRGIIVYIMPTPSLLSQATEYAHRHPEAPIAAVAEAVGCGITTAREACRLVGGAPRPRRSSGGIQGVRLLALRAMAGGATVAAAACLAGCTRANVYHALARIAAGRVPGWRAWRVDGRWRVEVVAEAAFRSGVR